MLKRSDWSLRTTIELHDILDVGGCGHILINSCQASSRADEDYGCVLHKHSRRGTACHEALRCQPCSVRVAFLVS